MTNVGAWMVGQVYAMALQSGVKLDSIAHATLMTAWADSKKEKKSLVNTLKVFFF